MCRKNFSINVFLSVLFLWSAIFPAHLFSYETVDGASLQNWTDESLDYKPVMYKKIRCTRCGMEFYYIPERESPHSQWVHYEVSEKELEYEDKPSSKEGSEDADVQKIEELYNLFSQNNKEEQKNKVPADLLSREGIVKKKISAFGLGRITTRYYKLRQKLTCPYDRYSFFPEGDVIEDTKLMNSSLFLEEPSVIETSYAKSIPFGVSKELRQFGYSMFLSPEEKGDVEAGAGGVIGDTDETLSTLGLLKATLVPTSLSSTFSADLSSNQTPVVPVGPDYILGPGDMLVINIWGSVQESFPVDVDGEGKIMLPKAGPLYIWGLEFKEAEDRIRERLNKFYTNFNVDVSMGKLRNIQIFVMGEVKKPGAYILNSQAKIFKALYEAGGPTKLGSLRKIKVINANGKERMVDLYPFLLKGRDLDYSKLQSGDTIFVPGIGDTVAIAGNVKRPAIFETKSDILFSELLNFSGGVTPTGDLQRLQVERIENNERRVMVDIELKSPDREFSLNDISIHSGDFVIVSPIVRLKHDFVSVLGNVERPGDYALSRDMKVSDLIERAKGFLPGTYLPRAEIARITKGRARQIIPMNLDKMMLGEEEEDVILNEWDILLIYSEAEVRPPSFVEIDGAVNRPGKYELTPQMKISDLIFKAGGVRQTEVIRGAELFHLMPGEQPVVRDIGIKRVADSSVLIDTDIILRGGDSLFVKSEPKLTERGIVTIKGEVKYPGIYSIREGERLSSLVERAGGLTEEAFLEGVIFTRESIREAQEKMRQRFIERENRSLLEEQQFILLGTTERVASSKAVSESLKIRGEMLNYIASAEIEGRMVVKLKAPSQLKGSEYDILLEDGDTLIIPQPPSAITIIGSINNPASVPFEKGRGVEYYIRKTGGLTKHADRKAIYVIRANGEAVSKFMMSKKVDQGDTIVVPQEFKYWTPPGQVLRDTVEILSRIVVGVGIIAALD